MESVQCQTAFGLLECKQCQSQLPLYARAACSPRLHKDCHIQVTSEPKSCVRLPSTDGQHNQGTMEHSSLDQSSTVPS